MVTMTSVVMTKTLTTTMTPIFLMLLERIMGLVTDQQRIGGLVHALTVTEHTARVTRR